MKKLTLSILLALASTAIMAQAPASQAATQSAATKTLEQRADELTAGMVKNLRLSPDQTKKVKAINLTSLTQAEEARVKHKADPRQLAQQMEIISQTRLSNIKDVLTQQQFSQYQQRREEKMGVPREAQSNPGSGNNDGRYQQQH